MSIISQTPDSVSASAPEQLGELRVEVPHWSAEVRVVDNLYRPVSLPPLQPSGVLYVTQTMVPAGVYDVEVQMGVKIARASLIVRPGKRPAVFSEKDWGELPTESTPVVSDIPVRQNRIDAAQYWSHTQTWKDAPGGPSRLFVFTRAAEPQVDSSFASGLTLRGESVAVAPIELANFATTNPGEGWMAFTADLPPGYYVLGRLAAEDGVPAREQPIYLLNGWETHAFMPAQTHPSLRRMTLSLARLGQGFKWSPADALATEAVFDVLQRGSGGRRLVTRDHMSTLVEGEEGNPWLGILAAYALVQSFQEVAPSGGYWEERESSYELWRELRQYLAVTIPDHPDVAALSLPDDRGEVPNVPPGHVAHSFPYPPLLRLGLKLVQRQATRDMTTIPLGSMTERVSRRLVSNSPWTAWRSLEEEPSRPRSPERRTAGGRTVSARPIVASQAMLAPSAPIFHFDPRNAGVPSGAAGDAPESVRGKASVSTPEALRDAALIHLSQSLVIGRELVTLPESITLDEKAVLTELLLDTSPTEIAESCDISLAETQRGLDLLHQSSDQWAARVEPSVGSGGARTPQVSSVEQSILGYALQRSQAQRVEKSAPSSAISRAESATSGDKPTAVTPFTIEDASRGLRGAADRLASGADQPADQAATLAKRLHGLARELLRRAALVAITDAQGNITLGNGALLAFFDEVGEASEQRETAWEETLRGARIGPSTIADPENSGRTWTLNRTVVKDNRSGEAQAYVNVLHASDAPNITQEALDKVESSIGSLTLAASLYAYGSTTDRAARLASVASIVADLEAALGIRAETDMPTRPPADMTVAPGGTLYDREFWAIDRHEAIADAAQGLLSDKARAEIRRVVTPIGANTGLVDLAAWADLVKRRQPRDDDDADTRDFLLDGRNAKADTWHYVNIPVNATAYSRTKYPQFTRDDDAVQILAESVRVLQGKSNRFSELNALRLVVHLVGDVHQPVHIGCSFLRTTGGKTAIIRDPKLAAQPNARHDRGGNDLLLPLGDKGVSLHSYWDGRLGGQVDLEEMTAKDVGAAIEARHDAEGAESDGARDVDEPPAAPGETRVGTVEKLRRLAAMEALWHPWEEEATADTTSPDTWGEEWATDALVASRSAYKGLRIDRPADSNGRTFFVKWEGKEHYDARCAPIVVNQMKLAVRHLADLLNTIWR